MSPRDAIRSSLPRYRRARSVKRKKLGELLYRDLANCRTVITNFSGEVMETRVNCMRRAAERQGLLRAGALAKIGIGVADLIASMLMTTAYHRLQRLPVSQDRPTCRRRRGVECADAGHPQSDRRPHRPRRACKSPPYCTPRKPTFFPPQVQDRRASCVRVRVRLRASRVLGSLKGQCAWSITCV
jgi:hypothetical protein